MTRAIWPARCFSAFVGNEPSSRAEHLKRDCWGCAFPWQLWEVEHKGDRPWRGRENPSLQGWAGAPISQLQGDPGQVTSLGLTFFIIKWVKWHTSQGTVKLLCYAHLRNGYVPMMMWGIKSCMILYILCCVVLGCRADEVHKWKHSPAHHKPGWRVCTTVNTWPRKPHKNKQSRTSRSLSEKKSDSGSHDPLLNPSKIMEFLL